MSTTPDLEKPGGLETPGGLEKPGHTIRVLTYNVHSCIGLDRKLSLDRIGEVIARCEPDVVALQELDILRQRTGGVDQVEGIARYLEMAYHFHPAINIEAEQYGDAIMTHLPMRLVRASHLPGLDGRLGNEPRGALWVSIESAGVTIQCINTHLGLRARERLLQAEALLGPDWVGNPACTGPLILCGDFNAIPSSKVCRLLNTRLRDAQIHADAHTPRRTFISRYPFLRIDHVYVGCGLDVVRVEVPNDPLARVASDHLPVFVELELTASRTPDCSDIRTDS